ncbi:hypothetical protein PCANC_03764 [Puccinia coronata f. sp. avenae]|uniref:Diphthamide biosynthesis protein 3 n=1 Tax=Puccinia coronata f. sp. avenae TaxID=200324 RepID=A0A2N5SI79_9BASI|nr:hypothetical protein PCANC_19034 [Puccinia coronata f. sp. avenae]PLW17227.1 hypothetical protein PCASD_16485 [Puccinia coronata f. sp. avenae]PLW43059.1 hypothetical protein PCASD_06043 [Puccinia coronata f. sp. avenae]PLW53913.1 hypothetical protein PCANC_03764 [Puccinia coronata f. sp. avenae]
MVSYYDEIEIEDFTWDDIEKVYHTPCPCGDRFEITKSQLSKGVDVATCPSCSLIVRVVYDMLDFEDYESEEEIESSDSSSIGQKSIPIEDSLADLTL